MKKITLGHFDLLEWDIFQIIKIFKTLLWTEFIPDIHDIGTKFFWKKKQVIFNQIYIFKFTRVFGVHKDPKLQIWGQNWYYR